MADQFDDEEFKDSSEEFSNKDRMNNILGYIPFLNVWLLFIEKPETSEMTKRFNRQGIALFMAYIVIFLVLSLLTIKLAIFLTVIYIIVLLFFCSKAYNGLYVEVGFIESIIDMFTNKNSKK